MQATAKKTATSIDSEVVANADADAEHQDGNTGKRFYSLLGSVGTHEPIYAITSYTPEEDGEEVESVESVGAISASVSLRKHEESIMEELRKEVGEGVWDYSAVDMAIYDLESYLKDRIPELLGESAEFTGNGALSVSSDTTGETRKLASESEFGRTEWETFLFAVGEATDVIQFPGDGYRESVAYTFDYDFESVVEWRSRAVENYWCSVFRTESRANLAALDRYGEEDMTQAEMAEELGKSSSTISLQMQDVRELRRRTEWTCENR